jgi:uncharacterized membrane protein YfcA
MQYLPLLFLVAGGFVGGFFGSAVGSAGLISLPILILLGFPPHLAVATTRPAAVVLELVSAIRYWREGKLTMPTIRKGLMLGILGAVGGVTGAFIISTVSDQTLRLLFALVISSMLIFLVTKKNWGMHEHPQRQKQLILIALSTFLIGIYGGFFGFTFGTLMTIALVAFGFNLLQSAVLARVIGILTASAAAIVFAFQGSINYPAAVALSIGFAAGAWVGAGVGAKRGNTYVKKLLIAVVVCSVVKLLFDYVSAGG